MMKTQPTYKREWVYFLILLTAGVLLFWWRAWIPSPQDRMHFTDDILVKDYPTRLGLFRTVTEGHLPLWDPYQFGGWPGLANCEAGLFYPFNWLLLPFVEAPQAAFQATQWLVLLHFVIAGLGAYRLARGVGLSAAGAAMTAIAYTFCGFHCAHKKHTNMFFTIVWLPWILWQAEVWIRERKPPALIRMTLLLALAYAAGHPQAALYMTILVTARFVHAAVVRSADRNFALDAIVRGSLPIVLVIGAAAMLTAAQWLPLWELIQQGERSGADVFQSSTEFSLPPFELVDAILPEALSDWSHVEVFYWGGIPLLLVAFTLLRGKMDSFDRFWLAAAVLAVLLAMGEYMFVYDLSYVLVPGVAWVRAPSRWIYFASLPIALLAGRGIDLLFSREPAAEQESGRTFVFMTGIWLSLLAIISLYILPNVETAVRLRIVQEAILQVLFSGTFLLSLFLRQYGKIGARAVALLAIFLTWSDLGTHYRTLDMSPGRGGYEIGETVERLHEAGWSRRSKIFLEAGGNRTLYHGAAQNFYEVDGQSPLTPRLHLELRQDTAIPFPLKPNYALLRMLGVGAILTDHEQLAPPAKKAGDWLFLLDTPQPRARVYHDFFYAEPEAQRQMLSLQSFPFQSVLLVTEEEPAEEEFTLETPLFPKPFLLASGSIEAVQKNALLVVDGENHFKDLGEEPGYYIAVADADTGEIKDTARFNLMESYQTPEHPAHQAMREFIAGVPTGDYVFVALRDNAANVLFAEGLATFRLIGASADLREGYQTAHAIVGRKGAPLGSAVEIFSPTEALILQTPQSLTRSGVTAAPPQVEYHATTVQASEWFDLKEELSPPELGAYHFAPGSRLAEEGSALPVLPITIYSVPKKSGGRAVLLPAEDRASIRIGGQEYSPNRVGYNLVVLDPKTHDVEAVESFNLLQDYDLETLRIKDPPAENRRLQEFIRSVTEGHVILGAIRDEATDLIQPETLASFRLFGSAMVIDTTTPENRRRFSHAFIGIKGGTECVEAYAQETDAIVFTRYLGGPVLLPEDLSRPETYTASVHPLEEIIRSASDTTLGTGPAPGEIWGVEDHGPNRLTGTGRARDGGILFLSEIVYPGWQARVDGIPQPIHRVNYYFRGVRVPPGLHEVELVYAPAMVTLGANISLTAAALLAAGLLWAWWSGRKP